MFKRISAFILAIVLVLSIMPAVRAEDAVLASGQAGDDITWTLTADYHLSLTGTGPMHDYKASKAPWYSYADQILTVSVEEGITSIGNYALWNLSALTTITLPETILSIGEHALFKCIRLEALKLPDSCTIVNTDALNNCDNLVDLVLPESLVTLGMGALANCDNLTSVTIHEGVTTIGKQAFMKCPKLRRISIPASVTEIGEDAFDLCPSMTSITVDPANTVYYSDSQGALYDDGITTLITAPDNYSGHFTIPETVTTLAKNAFRNCGKLTGITIPDGCLTLGDEAFAYTALQQVTIPEGVTEIPSGAFFYCEKLTEVSIPETVTSIGRSAFGYCESLEEITLPEYLESMDTSTFTNCEALRSIVVPEGITELYATFHGCYKLETVVLPSTLKEITTWCFMDCNSLRVINLPEGLEEIGTSTFKDTFALKSITIPSTVKTIGDDSFDNSGLKIITFLGSAPEFKKFYGEDVVKTFRGVTATVYYPGCDPTWAEALLQEFEGDLTWVPREGHTWLEPTCTEPRRCAGCGVTEGEALGHDYGEWYVAQTPSCTTDGLEQRDCSRCGGNETRELPASGHSYTAAVIAPTCTESGYTLYTCACGDSYTEAPSEPLGHDWHGLDCRRCDAHRENPFADTDPLGFYFDAVLWAVDKGITNGISATEFGPDQACNRAQVVTFLWRACVSPEPRVMEHPFVDVQAGSFYEKAVIWAVEKGITNGLDATHFGPNTACNRAQVVTFLWRTMDKPASNAANPFTDVKAGDFYYEAVLWAVERGITNGLSATEFGVNSICNRAQIVTFLYRTLN